MDLEDGISVPKHVGTNLMCTWSDNKVRELDIRGIVHYEFVPTRQSSKFTIWKYRKGCVEKLDGNDSKFLPTTHGSCITTMHLLTL
jgi:hypothetical protein